MDFCSETTNYLVPSRLVPVRGFQVPVPREARWAEPDRQELRALLRWVAEHPDDARESGARAALAARAWSWERACFGLLSETGII